MAGQRKQVPGAVTVLAVAGVVVLVGLTAVFLLPRPGGSSPEAAGGERQAAAAWSGFVPPDYVLSAPKDVQTAYRFALERPDAMMWMPCYCGCGQHSNHKSAYNCFIKQDTTSGEPFDSHGAGCDMCVGIALDVKALTEEGRTLRDIRAFIDEKYGSVGEGTDTPLPPAS